VLDERLRHKIAVPVPQATEAAVSTEATV
jgi:hypothetical protein